MRIINSKLLHSTMVIAISVLNIIPSFGQSDLQKAVDDLVANEVYNGASMSICIMEHQTHEVLAGHDQDRNLIPASTLKVATTHTGLILLGEDFKFETKLLYDGRLKDNGVLDGNLIVRGYGDPTLGSSVLPDDNFLAVWTRQVKMAGIKEITGALIIDDLYFEDSPLHGSTSIEDGGNYYAAGVHGINVYDNQCQVVFSSGPNAGDETQIIAVKPEVPELTLVNKVTSGNHNRDEAYIHGYPGSTTRTVYGSIPKGRKDFIIKASVPNPSSLLGKDFEASLEENGIHVALGYLVLEEERTFDNETAFYTHYSPELSEIVRITNIKSFNLFAAAILKQIGMQKLGVGSYEAGAEAILNYWQERGLDTKGMNILDGSGLSRANMANAYQLATISGYGLKRTEAAIQASLKPYMGRSKLIVKTGYVDRVRAFTGRTTLDDGIRVSFSIMVNNYSCTASQAKKPIAEFLKAITQK